MIKYYIVVIKIKIRRILIVYNYSYSMKKIKKLLFVLKFLCMSRKRTSENCTIK